MRGLGRKETKKETNRRQTSATGGAQSTGRSDINTRITTSQFRGFSPNNFAGYFHGQEQGRVPTVAIGLVMPDWALPKRSANALSRAAAAVRHVRQLHKRARDQRHRFSDLSRAGRQNTTLGSQDYQIKASRTLSSSYL